ncbi:Methuselah N-terminal domain [Trinorchestia longiramus]|nr:Methuselah N-terminal domain [Trinorchestia longiramus]
MFSCRLVVRAIFPLYYLIAVCVGNDAVLKTLSNNVSLKVSLDNQTLYEFLPLSGEDGQSYPQNLTELQWNEQVLRAALVEANDGNSTSPASVQNGGLSGAIDYDGIHYFEDFSGAGQKVEESRVSTDVIRQIENYGVSHPEFYSLLTLSKCHCEGRRQVWTGTACVDHHSDTIIAVLDENFSGPEISKPLWYGSVVVAPVQCSDGFVKNVFRGGDFNLLMGTELLHSWTGFVFPEGSFCIEHILDENGELSWLAEACVPPPIVPLCCSENQRLSVGTKECVETNETNFFPPIYKENTTFSVIDTTFNNITCSEDEEKRWMKLSHDDSLVYSVSGVSFSWVGAGALPVVLMPSDYCVAAENDNNTYWASFCYKDAEKDHIEKCSNATCVRKCCNEGLFYDITTLNCYSPKEEEKSFLWVPTFHHLSSDGSRIQEDRPVDYVPVYGFPLGCQFFILEPGTQTADEFFLLSNGSLHVPVWEEPVPPTSYCVDNFMLDGEDPTERAMVCFPEVVQEQTSCEKVSKVLQPSLLLISCVFLAITLAVYAIVPELHAKVHGKSLLSHVSSLLVAYSSLVIVQWGSSILPMPWCISMASVIHISFLASFFWLNVMCFDIYWTLRPRCPDGFSRVDVSGYPLEGSAGEDSALPHRKTWRSWVVFGRL